MVWTRTGEAIRQLDPNDSQAADNLADTIKSRSYQDAHEVVRLAHGRAEATKTKATAVLLRLGPLALAPLLDSLGKEEPNDYVNDMQTVVGFQTEMRARIAAVLEDMLADTRPLEPPNPFLRSDEKPIPTRVCDEAYLMLRQLLAFDESDDERYLNANAFLNMDDQERNAEIKRLLESRRWINLEEASESGD